MAQSLSKILVHAVWHIKYNSPEILNEDRVELYQYLNNLFDKKGCATLQINGVGNHVYVLFALSKTISLAKVMESIKSISSKWLKTRGNHYTGFAWQPGYGAFSVSESVCPKTKRYIARQEEHHQQITPHDEYIQLLTKNNVPFNEQYLFDSPNTNLFQKGLKARPMST